MTMLLLALLGAANAHAYPAVFLGCHDGDTCTFDLVLEDATQELGMSLVRTSRTVLQRQTARLCGLDAPELGTPDGAKARDALASWLQGAKAVELRVPQQAGHDAKDKYGRWLGWVVADGQNMNDRLLQEGLAVPYGACR